MTIDDVALLVRWDDDPDVAAAIGGRGADWYDWPAELIRDVPWRELLIAEEDGRPMGFLHSPTPARRSRTIGGTSNRGRGSSTSGSDRPTIEVADSVRRR